MTKWYDSDNPSTVVRGGTWRIMVWIVAFILFFSLIGIVMWAFGVFSSPIKGKGDAFKNKNSGVNRVLQQERFEDLYQEILAADRRIDVLTAASKQNPESQVALTNLTGGVTYCITAVGEYNALSRKYSAADFRAIDLPHQIDNEDPSTDCKETIQ